MGEPGGDTSRKPYRRPMAVAFLAGVVVAAVATAVLTRGTTSGTVRLSTAGTENVPSSTVLSASPTTAGAPAPGGSATLPAPTTTVPPATTTLLETAPLSGGHQVVQQLGAGTLRIDGTATTLSSVAGADVTVTPGPTTKVICATPRNVMTDSAETR